MSAPSSTDLTALIGSRICHDLISPLGAIGNGLELLQMGGALDGPEMALIAQSVANANARIRFFRIAFGAAGEGQRIGRSELAGILGDSYAEGRVQLSFDLPVELNRVEAKMALLSLLCLETALPYGGTLAVSSEGGWRITAHSEKLKLDQPLWDHLAGSDAETPLAAAQVQFALLPICAQQNGRAISVNHAPDLIEVRF